MTSRSELVKDIYLNGKQGTWDEYAAKYDLKNGKQANDFYRWFVKAGAIDGYWEPDAEIEEDETPREVVEDELIHSPLWKEFLEFRKSKHKDDYLPGRHLILPCVHVPFHNKALMNACLKLISDIKPIGLHIIGDFLDMNSLSSHDKGSVAIPGITLQSEYEAGNDLLDQLIAAGDFKKKTYIYGNHEDRYHRHMSKTDNAKYGSALPSPKDALRLEERGFEVKQDWQQGVVYLGKFLELVHGSYFNIHSAKKHIDVYRTSIVYAHTHRMQSYIEGNVGGYNIGWMGDQNSPAFNYASRGMKETWNNGFAVIDIDEQGYYFVNQVIWQNGKFYYGGKNY